MISAGHFHCLWHIHTHDGVTLKVCISCNIQHAVDVAFHLSGRSPGGIGMSPCQQSCSGYSPCNSIIYTYVTLPRTSAQQNFPERDAATRRLAGWWQVHASLSHSSWKQSTLGCWLTGMSLQCKSGEFFWITNCGILSDREHEHGNWQIWVDLAKSFLIEENNNYDYYCD